MVMEKAKISFPFPTWLKTWLNIEFYSQGPCQKHGTRKYPTLFCLHCLGKPLCDSCWYDSDAHRGHPFVQVRRASHRAAINVHDMAKIIDTSGIQPFWINGSRILYLKGDEKKDPRMPERSDAALCEVCCRPLMDETYNLCSIECKAKSISNSRVEWYEEECSNNSRKRTFAAESNGDVSFENGNAASATATFRIKRRKGIPCRAPLF